MALIENDLRNAGANWVDREVVVDKGLVSSRKPADIPAFNRKMVDAFAGAVVSTTLSSREVNVVAKSA